MVDFVKDTSAEIIIYIKTNTLTDTDVTTLANRCKTDLHFAHQLFTTSPPQICSLIKRRLGAHNLKELYLHFENQYASKEMHLDFYNKTPDCLAVHLIQGIMQTDDPDTEIIDLRECELSYISYAAEQLIGKKNNLSVPTTMMPAVNTQYATFLKTPQKYTLQTTDIIGQETAIPIGTQLTTTLIHYKWLHVFSWKSLESKILANELYDRIMQITKHNMQKDHLTGKQALELYQIMHRYMENVSNQDKTLYLWLKPIYFQLAQTVDTYYQEYCARKDEGYYIAEIKRIINTYHNEWFGQSSESREIIQHIKSILNPYQQIERIIKRNNVTECIDTGKYIRSNPNETMPNDWAQLHLYKTSKINDDRSYQLARINYLWRHTYAGETSETLDAARNRLTNKQEEPAPGINNTHKRFYHSMKSLMDEMQQNNTLEKVDDKTLEEDVFIYQSHKPRGGLY